MEMNKDTNIVVMDKDMYRTLLQYAHCGERDCGPAFFGKTVEQIQKHVSRFNLAQHDQHLAALKVERLTKVERRRLVKVARRMSSQRETVRYMADHDQRLIFPVMIIGKTSDQLRLKYRSLCDGWESEVRLPFVYETREELPADYRVVQEGERIE
ncbi:hypothetical protein MPK66_gp054 [Erwinia phage pEa_SNUABM_2]|uniref:Uncharacterized protein n=1 Tax=Erwinia phage pEa_SNUABM_2 TaxID=2869547 RepID=A0AAE7XPC8_9CAUD|nr:hypothetical protein MPK66_gp054 [Erwinia phage pEa_SNUABM_2]QZE59298.1 hypothetical protein pEaSNUABM2_00054 [Erwinia phage pEa_SNUABM_2]QZE59634.1 hypothetical protein pEaSNUABM39_00054 [Erwinia phage pEa_SNUABM_39]